MSKTILFYPKLEPHKDFHYMPISLLAVAAPMVDVTIVDERVGDSIIDQLKKPDVERLMISAYTGYQVFRAYIISEFVREYFPWIKITWGGPHVTALPEQTLASGVVDEVVCGDVDNGEHPLPCWLIDIEKYINPETKRFIYVSSYGCPSACSFCATKNKRPFKLLPIERIQSDIDYLMTRYPFRECVFFDATLFTVPDRVKQINEIMRRYNLQWIADARAPEIAKADDSFLELCVNSGLKQLTIGLESGSPRIVDIMKKGKNHLEYFRQAAEKLAKLPVKMVSGVVFGTPGETVEDLQQTIDYIQRIRETNPNFLISTTFFRPLPGTEMTDLAKQYGYKEPQSLQEWTKLGEQNHYSYNEYREACWIPEPDKHRALYERFKSENKELFV